MRARHCDCSECLCQGWHTCGQGGSTFWHRGSWAAHQAEEKAPQPAARSLWAGDPLYRTTASPGWEANKNKSDAMSSHLANLKGPPQFKCPHSLRVALALTAEHLGASRDWRETGHLRMVSPSSGTQKNWNLLWRQGKQYVWNPEQETPAVFQKGVRLKT